MGRAEADRLACCKVLMVHYTHCEVGGKGGGLSMEELKVLRSHRKPAEESVGEARTYFLQDSHAVDQNCCSRYSQGVHSC